MPAAPCSRERRHPGRPGRKRRSRLLVPRVLATADVTNVVIKRENDSQPEQALVEAIPAGALISVEQSRHRQGDVHHVLHIMITGIARVVIGVFAAVERGEILKRLNQAVGAGSFVPIKVDATDLCCDRVRICGLDAVGHVVIVAALSHLNTFPERINLNAANAARYQSIIVISNQGVG